MLQENLKILRKNKGVSQQQLADQMHVVRQTVSKWEKGLSVPDAEMLMKLAEFFEVTVSQLLGAPIKESSAPDAVAQQLARINEQLAIRNRRARRIWTAVAIFLALIVLYNLLSFAAFTAFRFEEQHTVHTETIEP